MIGEEEGEERGRGGGRERGGGNQQRWNSCCYLSADDLQRGHGYRHRGCPGSANTNELTVRQGPASWFRRLQLPMLGDLIQSSMFRDRFWKLLSLWSVLFPSLPTSRLEERSGFGHRAPAALPRLPFLGSKGPGKQPLGPRPKSTTCCYLRLPRFRSGNFPKARSSAFCRPLDHPAHAHGGRINGPTGTEHAWEPWLANVLQKGGAFPGGLGVFLHGIGHGTLAPDFEKNQQLGNTGASSFRRSLSQYSKKIEICVFHAISFPICVF